MRPSLWKPDVEGDDEHLLGQDEGAQEQHEQVVAEAEAQPGEGVGAQKRHQHGQQRAAGGDDDGVEDDPAQRYLLDGLGVVVPGQARPGQRRPGGEDLGSRLEGCHQHPHEGEEESRSNEGQQRVER